VAGSASGATHFRGHRAFTFVTARKLALIPRMRSSRGFRTVGCPSACPPSYGASDSYPGRSFSCWTQQPFLDAQPAVRLSPHRALQRPTFLLQDYSQIRHPVGFHLLRHQHFRGLRLVASGIVDLLVPFALGPAFPAADYYGTSDAAQVSPPEL